MRAQKRRAGTRLRNRTPVAARTLRSLDGSRPAEAQPIERQRPAATAAPKVVYVAMSADLIHPGHLNIIQTARELGEVTVGLLTDERSPATSGCRTCRTSSAGPSSTNIKGVVAGHPSGDARLRAESSAASSRLRGARRRLAHRRPAGDAERVIDALAEWGGQLVEPEYTEGISSTQLSTVQREIGTTPEIRLQRFRRLLEAKPLVRVLEAHNGLTGLIVEHATVDRDGCPREFDAMWLSSLTDSIGKGKPDIEYVDLTSRMSTVHDILEVTTKPIIFDGDTGGITEHFVFTVKTLERLGVSAVIIEDKVGLKKNSLFGHRRRADAGDPADSPTRSQLGKRGAGHRRLHDHRPDRVAGARQGHRRRARAGARPTSRRAPTASCLTARKRRRRALSSSADGYEDVDDRVPLAVVPTAPTAASPRRSSSTAGVRIVIYANHLLRQRLSEHDRDGTLDPRAGRAQEADECCMSIRKCSPSFQAASSRW